MQRHFQMNKCFKMLLKIVSFSFSTLTIKSLIIIFKVKLHSPTRKPAVL